MAPVFLLCLPRLPCPTLGVCGVVELGHVLPLEPHRVRLAVRYGHLHQQVLRGGGEEGRGGPGRVKA